MPGDAGRLSVTLHPLAKLLYGLQSTALTLSMQPGGCTALQLLTFSQASICSHPKVTGIELPPHSHPHYPRAVKAPTVFPQNPPFLHANLIHCSPQAHPANPFGQQVGNFIPIFFLLPPLCTSQPFLCPQHLYPPPTGPPTPKPLLPTSFYKGGRSSPHPQKSQGSSPVGCQGRDGLVPGADLTSPAVPVCELVGLGRQLGRAWQGDWVLKGGLCHSLQSGRWLSTAPADSLISARGCCL